MTLVRIAIIVLMGSLPAGLRAQSALSTQGFGYPSGGLSVRSAAVGGGTAEIDPLSVLNPAAIANWGASGVAAQFSPERRTVSGEGASSVTTSVRFPGFTAGVELGGRFTMGLAASTFLDRTWTTTFTSSQLVEGQLVESTTTWSSLGAINDVRMALGYRLTDLIQVGAAFHVLTGKNDVRVITDFSGTDFQDIALGTTLGYSGNAVSGGVILRPIPSLMLGGSVRSGGTINIRREGNPVSDGDVPDRFGASLVYSGLGSATISVRYDNVLYSQMNGLGSTETVAHDARDLGAGIEVSGPALLRNPTVLRMGYRQRDLPFEAGGAKVSEGAASAGIGVFLARGRSLLDVSVIRANRTNASAFTESAWTFATGILIRP